MSDASLSMIPPTLLRSVLYGFRRFADESLYKGFFCDLANRMDMVADLPAGQALAGDLVYLGDLSVLRNAMPSHRSSFPLSAGMELEFETPAEQLWRFAGALNDLARHGLDVLLRRALNPFEALATWPLNALFASDEVARIGALPRSANLATPEPDSWSPGKDAGYEGWVCAIVKFTRLCNLRCVYCHDWRAGPDQTMTLPVQARLFHQLLQSPGHHAVDVIWHGGEPTLIGRRGFLRVLALQRWFQRPGQEIKNTIQTNATRIDGSWAEFLKRFNFHVGVSLDGPKAIHDAARPNLLGTDTLGDVRRGMRCLRRAGIKPGVLVVVGEAVLALGADALVEFLHSEAITEVGLLPVHPPAGPRRLGAPYIAPERYARFLLDVHKARKARPEPWLRVREIDAAIRAVGGERAGLCKLLGNCVGSFFAIEPDGEVSHCDRYLGDPDYVLGNIVDQEFDDIEKGERIQRVAMVSRHGAEAKRQCPYFAYCRAWCPHERYLAERYGESRNGSCCGLAELFDALLEE